MDTLVEFGKIMIPASVVLYATYLLIRAFLAKELDMKKLEITSKKTEVTLPLRLQAYERMTLFLERIAPQNMLVRMNNPTYKASDFHKILLNEIQNEYNHNISQQVYMSEQVWALIENGKNDLITQINEVASTMKEGATSSDLSKQIFQTFIERKIEPTAHPLSELKKEVQQLF